MSKFSKLDKTVGKSDYEPAPAGNHVAICYSIIDLGTQTFEYMGEKKSMRKVRVTWELPEIRKVFEEEKGEQPQVIGKEFTWSFHEKSNFRKMLEGWRSKKFTEEEIEKFDEENILGKPCLLNVIHKTSKDGQKTYAVIEGVSPVPKSMPVPEQSNPSFAYAIPAHTEDDFDLIPEFIQDKIKDSPEYQEKTGNRQEEAKVQTHPGNHPAKKDEDLAKDIPTIKYESDIKPEDVPF